MLSQAYSGKGTCCFLHWKRVSSSDFSFQYYTVLSRVLLPRLPTAIYGIQRVESTFSPGSDFSNGKTHKMSSEEHMHNATFERQSLENSDYYYLWVRLWYIEMGVIGSKSSTLACSPPLQVSLRINTKDRFEARRTAFIHILSVLPFINYKRKEANRY